ncbi:MAG: SpoIIE family protein phosphatase [Gammaproteobacteria bacterium]|nr:SpoIIE family protein phosphatase [Gammaproteobacteria bacterium]
MPDIYLIDHQGQLLRQISARNMPLGVLADEEFEPGVEVLEIPIDAHLYLHTDGLTEMNHPKLGEFGEERLLQLLQRPLAGRFEAVVEAIGAYRPDLPQEDDIALVALDLQRPAEILDQHGGELAQEQRHERIIPFQIQLELEAEDMRRLDPISLCSGILAQQPGLRPHKDMIHTLFAELYNNALEHSVLGLGSVDKSETQAFIDYYQQRQHKLQTLEQAHISLSFRLIREAEGELLEIQLQDSGRGFDAAQALERSRSEGLASRGLALLSQFSERLEYSNDGRQARLLYRLS